MSRGASLRLCLALLPVPAAAHPVDEVLQGAYLTIAPQELRLELDLTPGPEVAAFILQPLDADGNRRITPAEARAYAERVIGQTILTLDGAVVPWSVKKVGVPSYRNLEFEGDSLRIYALARRPDLSGSHRLDFSNSFRPAKSWCIANIFLQPGGGWEYEITNQHHSDDGRRLTVNYTADRR